MSIRSIILHLLNIYSVQEALLKILRQKRLIKLTDKSLEHIRHVMLTENIYILRNLFVKEFLTHLYSSRLICTAQALDLNWASSLLTLMLLPAFL